jgi:TonB family protein
MNFKLLLVLGSLSFFANAQDPSGSSKLIQSIEPAKAIKRVEPKYPNRALKKGYEGWVRLSYVIENDGSVSNVLVTDSSGLKSFEKSALKSLKKWQYSPAMDNGKAIQQCKNSIQLDYSFERNGEKVSAVSRKFKIHYSKILDSLLENDTKQALASLEELSENPRITLFEDRLLWQTYGHYYQAVGEEKKAMHNFEQAISMRSLKTADKPYLVMVKNVFKIQVKHRLYSSALATFAAIEKIKGTEDLLASLKPLKQKIETVIASDQYIAVNLAIGDRGFSTYRLVRNQFSLANVEGNVDKLQVYCDNKHDTFSYAADSAWNIPESWGQCSVYVFGGQKTAFDIVEYPKTI